MDIQSILRDLKNYILQFEYPMANSMNDEELAHIFKQSNRGFLISWMLKLIDIYEKTVSAEDTKLSGTILWENGFCTKDEIIPFMEGTLDPLEQLKILQNLFIYIETIKKQDSKEFVSVSIDDIETFSKNKLNLFPMYGEIKVMNTEKPSTVHTEKPMKENENTVNVSDSTHIAELIEDICLKLPDVKNVANNCQINEENNIKPCMEADDIFKTCNKHMKQVCQFLKDVKTIEEFNKNKHSWLTDNNNISTTNGTNREFLKELCNEIRDILQYQKLQKL